MKTIKVTIAALMLGALTANANVESIKITQNYSVSLMETLTSADITEYLQRNGYTVLSEPETADGKTWTCRTQLRDGLNYITTVYTDGVNILGTEDQMVD